ncbi:uncharacterized protein LOC101459515 [Ceratitis capitata]|uniref:(Mediterranean fruit fly) hypothetical protein n=2 Tax=Ceratitis capitata TaxID=7213 RepID=A0A811TX17_CERCA|nr:uncharacterized protein LOC101459515 [Ceratitis capitata]CAD6991342.1 unnamed protein product [Ceratitis capitata]
MEWPTEKLLRLIDLFKSKRCLWDPQDKNYKKSIIKDKSWNQISDELGGNAIETKKKMESLLASYRRERKKYELALGGSNPDKMYISKWFAFKAMSFMANRSFERKHLFDRQDPLDDITEQDSRHSQDVYGSKQDSEESAQKSLLSQNLTSPSSKEAECKHKCCPHTGPTINTRRDDSDIFGEYVSTKHRKYSDHVKSVVENHIAQILFDADMGLYNPGTTTTLTISARPPLIETIRAESPEIIYEK